MKKEEKLTPLDLSINSEERKKLAAEFLDSRFFNKYYGPMMKAEIERSDKISNINKEKVEKSFWQQTNKLDVYRGLLNKIYEWANKTYK